MAVHTAPGDRVPDEIRGWNWGAFLLNWVWGVGNNTYVSLLTLIPFFGLLIMPFVLGAKGNVWAWRNGRWDSVEHFKRVQRRWAMWGFILVGMLACISGALFGGVFYALKASDAYAMAVARLAQNRTATDLLGPPISTGFPSGSISTSGLSGQAALDFTVGGSKASGRVVVQAVKRDGVWSLTALKLLIPTRGEKLDLLGPQAGTPPPRRIAVATAAHQPRRSTRSRPAAQRLL